MKQLILILLFTLTGCVDVKQPVGSGKYLNLLPTHRGLIIYRSAVVRPTITSAVADERTKAWTRSMGRVLSLREQNSIRQRTDLVYLASLPTRRMPNGAGDLATLPPLRFFVTIDNKGDSSRVWVTNFEMTDQQGEWQMLERQRHTLKQDRQWTALWMADLDAAITEMTNSLNRYLTTSP